MRWLVLIVILLTASTGRCFNFNFTTASVTDVQLGILSGGATCRQIIQGYLDRVNAYNQDGPNIHAIISVNTKALMEAIRLDSYYNMTGRLAGILHCAPLIVKDNIDVAGLPTTAGWNAFKVSICGKLEQV